jgi:hypothetical protein
MEAIELVMKIWGIDESKRAELEMILKNTPSEHLGLALMNLASGIDDDEFVAANDKWMATYLPEVQIG